MKASVFEGNLNLIKERYPELADKLENIEAEGAIELARSGQPTLKVQREGQTFYLHSTYDPLREAARWAQDIYAEPDDTLVVCGIGLGYHLLRLSQLYPKTKIIACEPDPGTFKTALEVIDFSPLLTKENFIFYFGTERSEIFSLIKKHVDHYRPEKVKFYAYFPVTRKATDSFRLMEKALTDCLIDHILDLNTVMSFSARWTENFLFNLPETIHAPDVSIFADSFQGIPGIIVSAGPSLDKNIHLLQQVKDKALIIAAGTAAKAVLNAGLEPHLVVSVDGGEANGKAFAEVEAKNAVLVFDPVVYKSIPVNFKGPKIVGAYNPYFISWLDSLTGEKRTYLKSGPSVANTCFSLAVQLGLNPIIFIGQDLAYAPDGKTHSQKTIYKGCTVQPHEHLVEVEGFGGGKVKTSLSLACFLHWFEEEIPKISEARKIINATEGGARIKGTEEMSLQKAIELYLTKSYPLDETIKKAVVRKEVSPEIRQNIKADLKETLQQIRGIKRYARLGARVAQKLVDLFALEELPPSEKVDPAKEKLKQIDQKIFARKKALFWLEYIFQPAYQKLLRAGEEEDFHPLTRSRQIAGLSLNLYQEISKASEEVSRWIKSALDLL